MPRTSLTLCEQIGRFWMERSELDILFVEGEEVAPDPGEETHEVYAAPLPALDDRSATAASITPGASPPPEGLDVTTVHTIIIEARAATPREALNLLADLRAILRPGERPFVDPDPEPAPVGPGVIGPPELEVDETADLYRVVAIEFVNEPQALNVAPGPLATPDGQAAALWTIAIRTTPATITGS